MQNLRNKLLTITKPTIADKVCTYFAKTPYDVTKVHKVYKNNPYTICIDVDHYAKENTVVTIYIPLYTKTK